MSDAVRMPAVPAQPMPVTIVTGFLGVGKTTLLRSLVKRRQTRRLALLINEFGEVAIDGDLMRSGVADSKDVAQVQIHDFAYGLIAYGDDDLFEPTMLALAARRAQIDHILIETSGLALPTAVMERLQSQALAPYFILDATLAVVDTPLMLAGQFEAAAIDAASPASDQAVANMFAAQLEYADVVVLNKIDGLNEEQLLAAERQVRAGAPNVRFLELAYQAHLDIRLALGLRLHQATEKSHQHSYTPVSMPGADARVLADQSRLNGHAHSGLGAHTHGLATHKHFHEQDPGWMSFTLRSQTPQPADALISAVCAAARLEPVLRTKGFVSIAAGHGHRRQLLQGVRTRIHLAAETKDAKEEKQSVSTISELVFIGYHLSRSKIAAVLSETTGVEWK
ncbi:cobalamin biosynthesis protein CobW [Herbaspirillum sp. Sphag1AN]|uniref:CobW family GTP-binding protein n=1 Tax=unclassified Herbaspirillum TaxID=2624150 RepID=UPI00161136C2|nr:MULTISPECIES: GTP-binding protein [unclassified Herbaspirillum]MBB3213162.1 cobalamin biosynthesis protein CobW [Herbaspirillum sp. Sphag1AN]MBB3246359.1 cobalamin biosynthesis protein CobW [Herbaspirillum sp. Sphag64]